MGGKRIRVSSIPYPLDDSRQLAAGRIHCCKPRRKIFLGSISVKKESKEPEAILDDPEKDISIA